MSDFIEEIRCALAMRDAGYHALLGHEATAELLRRHDMMVKALEAAREYLESDVADGFRPAERLTAEIDRVLGVVGKAREPS